MGMTEEIAVLEAKAARVDELEQEITALRTRYASTDVVLQRMQNVATDLAQCVAEARKELLAQKDGVEAVMPASGKIVVLNRESAPPASYTPSVAAVPRSESSAGDLTAAERKILDALGQMRAVGVTAPPRIQVCLLAGYSSPKSGGFAAPAASLVRRMLVRTVNARMELTEAGLRELGGVPARLTNRDLHARLKGLLGGAEWTLLAQLIEEYPRAISREDLCRRAGYSSVKSGGFAAPAARIISLGFARNEGRGMIVGTPMLFVNGKSQAMPD